MTPVPNMYGWLEALNVTAPHEGVVSGVAQWIMRYYHVCELLRAKQFAGAVKDDELVEYGEAPYIIARSVAALVRGGLDISVESDNADLVTWYQAWRKKSMLPSLVVKNETELSTKGRSAILLEASASAKTIVARVLRAEYCWPKYDSAGALIGYRIVWPIDTDTAGGKGDKKKAQEYYQIEFNIDPDTGRTLRTSGKCIIGNEGMQYASFDMLDGKPVNKFDTGLDFLPVVHFDNVPNGDDLPLSDLHPVVELLQEQFRNNFDLSETAKTKAAPPLVIEGPDPTEHVRRVTERQSGAQAADKAGASHNEKFRIKPRTAIFTGAAGNRAYLLDTSAAIEALKQYDAFLTDRAITYSHLTRIGAGMLSGNDWPRFESLALAMRPLTDMVAMKVTMRQPKYELFPALVLRYAQARNFVAISDAVKNIVVKVNWPDVVPGNSMAEREQNLKEFEAGMISHETALESAAANGAKMPAAQDELKRIKDSEPDFTGATK